MQKNKQIYINLIVKDLQRATSFYEAIGFIKNSMFSNEQASCLVWSEEIMIMLLTTEFAKNFTDNKEIANPKKSVSAMYCISFNSKEDVDFFAEKAKIAGGRVYKNAFNEQHDFMYSFEVEDLDGYIWEPVYMNMSKLSKD